ncbi:MAG: cobaltochelatase subunit CobN [Acidimicrobiales bacterium]
MILFISNADTEILALRVVSEGLPEGFPRIRALSPSDTGTVRSLKEVRAVIVRLLGGRQAWEGHFDELAGMCAREGVPLLAFGGESLPDAEMMAASTVPGAIATQCFEYLVQGGIGNIENLLRFVADTVLMEGFGFDPPAVIPACGVLGSRKRDPELPTVGVVFYRAHLLAGNTQFVEELCDHIEHHGANAVPVFCYSLRAESTGTDSTSGAVRAVETLAEQGVDVVVTSTLAAGKLDEDSESWDAGALAALGVPVIQAVCSTSSYESWHSASAGLAPVDVAMGVAIPEFDGRIVSVPWSFKEMVDDGDDLGTPVVAYRCIPDRLDRVAGLAVRTARLRRAAPEHVRVAVVLSAYPTKRSRLGNAVGLDTPASVIGLLHAMRTSGYRVDRIPATGDELMEELASTLTYDEGMMATSQQRRAVGRMAASRYSGWFATMPPELRDPMVSAWGEPPGNVYVGDALEGGREPDLLFAGIDFGGVLVAIQPPRGFGADPIAVYHSPDLPPTHHYLAFYRWLDETWGADAILHMGKHGTLEWLPGKAVGLSASCAPDAALGSVPLVYPFVVNDPGEGTQAKRRTHAVIVDHLIPPLTRAEVYDDLARLETLLDEHARILSLDPAKLPAVRRQVWDCLVAAEIHRDMGLAGSDVSFDDPSFDDLIVEVDGYLCELKDAQIRGGLHVLGSPPVGEAQLDLVLALTRLPQGKIPSLRDVVADYLGIDPAAGRRLEIDAVEAECRRLLAICQEAGWRWDKARPQMRSGVPGVQQVLQWVCDRLIPSLEGTSGEMAAVLDALQGRFVQPGPSGSPSRGQAHVLPTGRNFYSVDPKAIPSRLAWDVGSRLADAVVERYVTEEGRYPVSVGLVIWGTSAMRTSGDDVAEALALLGVRPVWAAESGRVEGLEVVPLAELGRPRIDVTIRVSGFFRDAFPHVLGILDDAIDMVAALDEPPSQNPLAASGTGDPRIFGPKPGSYGSGILEVIESRNWRSDDDLAQVYLAWGGWSYSRRAMGAPALDALRRRLAGVEVAVKNQDNREHDIFDSDDYLQDHGGMVATIRALTGAQPHAFFGDSADPSRPRVRSLAEEAARVVRSRVVNPKWIQAMQRHGYKGAFEMAATVDYLFGYDVTARVVEDWMYERVTDAYVADPEVRKFFEESNPWALRSIAERLIEASERGLWDATTEALEVLRSALLEAEGWEEDR